MANRVTPLTNIETLSGNISAQTYFDSNIGPVFTATNDASLGWNNYSGTDTGSANNYLVSVPFGTPSIYNTGMRVTFKPANSNTGASTITVSPLASASILRPDGTACIGGEIVIGVSIDLIYNGTAFLIVALPWLPLQQVFVSVATNQSVNCQNASIVTVDINFTAAITLTLNNLAIGVPVNIISQNIGGSAFVLKLAANLPGGTAYTSILTKQAGSLSAFSTNWITTGVSFSASTGAYLEFSNYLSSGNAALVGVNA